MTERYGGGINGEFSSVEDDEPGIVHDVDVDRDGAAELAGGQVRFQVYVVAFRDREFREPRLPFEELHALSFHTVSLLRVEVET